MQQDASEPDGVAGPRRRTDATNQRAVRIARARKADAALAMKMAGASWAEIAEGLGYPTPRQALVATEKALQRQLATEEDREKMRRMAGARLDRLLRALWAKAIDPDHPDQMLAVGRARELVADHRKLFGLDAPTEVIVHNPTASEIEAWVATVLSTGAPPVEPMDVIMGSLVQSEPETG